MASEAEQNNRPQEEAQGVGKDGGAKDRLFGRTDTGQAVQEQAQPDQDGRVRADREAGMSQEEIDALDATGHENVEYRESMERGYIGHAPDGPGVLDALGGEVARAPAELAGNEGERSASAEDDRRKEG